jgi:hypothetical protein
MDMITSAVPAARFEHIVVNAVGGEVLVYDRASNQIHHLNESSDTVWRLCDGERTVADIARTAGSTDELARVALAKLSMAGLLDAPFAAARRGSALSRRKLLKTAAIAGAVPAVVSVTAPSAAAAGSCQPGDAIECRVVNEPCCTNGTHGTCLQNGQGRFLCDTT